jgi:hypothetical protein
MDRLVNREKVKGENIDKNIVFLNLAGQNFSIFFWWFVLVVCAIRAA